ncbi:MAG: DUF5076 domain-containing protein [Verrucomicrobiota bacterium JB023]|nr:DUF5076 domain-containing protein [Verrucomicrobiota bacterium JB023]
MKKNMRALEPPEEVLDAHSRQEVFRAWIDGGMLSVSLCNVFPESYREDVAEIWGMLISDIFHHVVDAIVLKTGRAREDVQEALRTSLDEVVRSERGTRHGTLKKIAQPLPEIPDPDVTGDENCVEIVRIALIPDSIRVMVLVGMWLPDDEESVWGNLLYDICAMVAESLAPERNVETSKSNLLTDVVSYIDGPSTKYSGEYYKTEQGGDAKTDPQV